MAEDEKKIEEETKVEAPADDAEGQARKRLSTEGTEDDDAEGQRRKSMAKRGLRKQRNVTLRIPRRRESGIAFRF